MTRPILSAGTIALTNGSATVTGTGTAFGGDISGIDSAANPSPIASALLIVPGVAPHVAVVERAVSDTELTLATNWVGSTASSEAYLVVPLGDVFNVVASQQLLRQILDMLEMTQGAFAATDGPPDNADGADGDFRIDINSPFDLYFKDGGVWANKGSVKGETGTPGVGSGGYGLPAGGEDGQVPFRTDGPDGEVEWKRPVSPIFNMITSGGRFADKPESSAVIIGSFAVDFYQPYNGAVFSDGGKFTQNNSTYGGSGAALPTIVDDLLVAQGVPSGNARRYGPEWHVLKVTAGSGTAVDPIDTDHYMMAVNKSFPIPFEATLSYWVKTEDSIWLKDANSDLYLNGVNHGGHQQVLAADGWVHVMQQTSQDQRSVGYHNTLCSVFARAGEVFYVALPVFTPTKLPADFRHKGPIPHYGILE